MLVPYQGLQLVSLTREDTGVYECLAENALGQASASARLRVEGESTPF